MSVGKYNAYTTYIYIYTFFFSKKLLNIYMKKRKEKKAKLNLEFTQIDMLI